MLVLQVCLRAIAGDHPVAKAADRLAELLEVFGAEEVIVRPGPVEDGLQLLV